jgi:hypothetical protein
MANRSYLFATDLMPSPCIRPADGRMIGISEWNYDIPTAFRLLLTGNPHKASSSIWDVPERIAIVGAYSSGVDRLLSELNNYSGSQVVALRDEARAFLTDPANQRKFFVLECGEIFGMNDVPLEEQSDRLLREIEALRTSPSVQPNSPARTGLAGRLFGRAAGVPRVDWNSYGLGNWSNVLYYEPSASHDGEAAADSQTT